MQAEDDWVPSEIKFSGGVILDGIEVASDTIQLSDEDIMILREFQSQETDGLQSSSICLPTSGVAHGGIISKYTVWNWKTFTSYIIVCIMAA